MAYGGFKLLTATTRQLAQGSSGAKPSELSTHQGRGHPEPLEAQVKASRWPAAGRAAVRAKPQRRIKVAQRTPCRLAARPLSVNMACMAAQPKSTLHVQQPSTPEFLLPVVAFLAAHLELLLPARRHWFLCGTAQCTTVACWLSGSSRQSVCPRSGGKLAVAGPSGVTTAAMQNNGATAA